MADNVECLWQDDRAIVALDPPDHVVSGPFGHFADELSDDDSEELELTWRLCPEVSLSDWTIQIVLDENAYRSGGSSSVSSFGNSATSSLASTVATSAHFTSATNRTTYHVHKSVLAIGPRRSGYFMCEFTPKTPKRSRMQNVAQSSKASPTAVAAVAVSVMQDDSIEPCDFFQEGLTEATRLSKEIQPSVQWALQQSAAGVTAATAAIAATSTLPPNTTRLALHPLQAAAMEILLDYLYSNVNFLEISTATCVGLASLALLLEMKALRRLCRDFWMANMTMDNLCVYYEHAVALKEDEVLQEAEEHAARHMFTVHETKVVNILKCVDSNFFLRTITHDSIGSGVSVSLRLSLLTAVYGNLHKHVLDASQFYKLTSEFHLPAIEVKAAKVLLELEDEICGPLARNPKRVSSLQERCVHVLSNNWDHACVDAQDLKHVSLPRLQGLALEEFVSSSFTNAKERLLRTELERDNLMRRDHDLERQAAANCNAIEQLLETEQELESILDRVQALELQLQDTQEAALRKEQSLEQQLQDTKEVVRLQRATIAEYEQQERDLIPKVNRTTQSKLTARYEQALES